MPDPAVTVVAATLRDRVGVATDAPFSGEFTDANGERVAYVGDSSAIFDDYATWALEAIADTLRAYSAAGDALRERLGLRLWHDGPNSPPITSGPMSPPAHWWVRDTKDPGWRTA